MFLCGMFVTLIGVRFHLTTTQYEYDKNLKATLIQVCTTYKKATIDSFDRLYANGANMFLNPQDWCHQPRDNESDQDNPLADLKGLCKPLNNGMLKPHITMVLNQFIHCVLTNQCSHYVRRHMNINRGHN